jgi:hypothetical protein
MVIFHLNMSHLTLVFDASEAYGAHRLHCAAVELYLAVSIAYKHCERGD